MADKDRDDAEGPSLEMPSLGGMLRRRKGKDPTAQEQPVEPVTEPVPGADPETLSEAEPVTVPDPVAPPLFADELAADDEVAAPTPAAAESPAHDTAAETSLDTAAVATATRTPDHDAGTQEGVEPTEKRRRELALPQIPSRAAAALTGVVVGLLAVGLTWLGLQGCELIRGTESCGGVGLLMLLLILAAMVALGAVMLKAWGIPDAPSTSVLAVGLIAVICLLLLIDVLMSGWMLLVIPLVGAATYALSHAVTAKSVDAGDS